MKWYMVNEETLKQLGANVNEFERLVQAETLDDVLFHVENVWGIQVPKEKQEDFIEQLQNNLCYADDDYVNWLEDALLNIDINVE